MIAIYNVF